MLAAAVNAIALLLSVATPVVLGGNCWAGMTRGGRCTDLLQEKVTREQCCALAAGSAGTTATASVSTAWSEQDMDAGMLFFWRVLGGGVPCQACRDSCSGVSCGPGRRCAVRWGRPQCVCSPDCATGKGKAARRRMLSATSTSSSSALRDLRGHPGPVCGSDGRSYRSVCRLLKRACRRKNTNLAVEYHGTCQNSCDRVLCGPGQSCVQDQNMAPHCVHCERRCPPLPAKPSKHSKHSKQGVTAVCGADGNTYPSACHLREAACRAGKAIPVAYRGHCQRVATCGAVHCRRQQTCLTDLASGAPRCVTCSMRCPATPSSGASKRRGGAARGGRGGGGFARRSHGSGNARGSGGARLRELVSLDQGRQGRQSHQGAVLGLASVMVQGLVPQDPQDGLLCGSNNRTYSSWCSMRKDACATGYVIDPKHAGSCSSASSANGEEPSTHLNAVLDENNAFS